MTSILDIPPEIMLMIFNYILPEPHFAEPDYLVPLLGVCRAWRALAADASLWRGIPVGAYLADLLVRHHPQIQFQLKIRLERPDTEEHSYSGFGREPRGRFEGYDAQIRWTRELLRAATDDELFRAWLREAVVGLRLSNNWSQPHLRRARDDLAYIFAHSQQLTSLVNEVNSGGILQYAWASRVERMDLRDEPIDCTADEIAKLWPRLKHLRLDEIDELPASFSKTPNVVLESFHVLNGLSGILQIFLRNCPELRCLTLRAASLCEVLADATLTARLTDVTLNSVYYCEPDIGCISHWASNPWPRLKRLTVFYDKFHDDNGPGTGVRQHLQRLISQARVLRFLEVTVFHEKLYPEAPSLINAAVLRAPSLKRIDLVLWWTRSTQETDTPARVRQCLTDIAQSVVDSEGAWVWADFWGRQPIVHYHDPCDLNALRVTEMVAGARVTSGTHGWNGWHVMAKAEVRRRVVTSMEEFEEIAYNRYNILIGSEREVRLVVRITLWRA